MPCDALEQTRLEILHRIFLTALSGALTTAPLPPGIQRVLDVGTGPGEWACQMAEQFPDAEIVAVDLAVWDLPAANHGGADASDSDADGSDGEAYTCADRPNVVWEIDDLEVAAESTDYRDRLDKAAHEMHALSIDQGYASGSTGPLEPTTMSETFVAEPSSGESNDEAPAGGWNFSEPFDFVHLRNMKGAFSDWGAVYREAFESLAPGGLLEVVDLMMDLDGGNGSGDFATSALRELVAATVEAAAAAGRPLGLAHLDRAQLEEAGFVDVHRTVVDVPMGPWPADERRAVMGKMWLVACAEGIEALCLRLLTRTAGWSVERVRERVGRAREELLMGRHGGVRTEICFVTARKARRRK
ncbi:uncharacterized protein K452DRAFT_286558 [Aplosporella prunicola CBS 121167]|uniref:Methyltransferase domain-containing protein n=1 Tax=Aplosporella prunicola CBS 121167 TaxID=1176127 RepID=A0A6A6BFT4_9PEZI|nr:uncharacterized protein K452DRAFT_286558 [Aplosporella prunicola CBS 121167]KAF2142926.1 hypothetical protein K452DRAFT_286558 [Aplosporella prunicola CBS 121167]